MSVYTVKNVDEAVSFYKRAFGAEQVLRLSMPDGKVVHCELKFGDFRLNSGESMEGWTEHTLLAQIFGADSDAVFAQAVKAGAEVLSPMTDMFFGSREGRVLDPFGSTWTISSTRKTFRSKKCSSVSMHSPPNARASILGSIILRTTTKNVLDRWNPLRLRIGYSHSQDSDDERMQRESSLIATIRKKLPEFAKACADDTELVLLHQDAFAADYQDDEYALLGMAIKVRRASREGDREE